jgi:hypothetical protein
MPAAQTALERAGIQPTMYPPPGRGGPVRQGLANIAFAHEAAFPLAVEETIGMVRDARQLAAAQFEEWVKEEERRRHNPLYWIDRGLRALFGLPAYIISLLVPSLSFANIDSSAFGAPLRVLSVASEGLGIYWIGRSAGWW